MVSLILGLWIAAPSFAEHEQIGVDIPAPGPAAGGKGAESAGDGDEEADAWQGASVNMVEEGLLSREGRLRRQRCSSLGGHSSS